MSASKESEKGYDLATVITRITEAISKIPQGQLPSNVFQRPHDSSTYDSVAATARMQQQGYVNGYSNLMMMQPQVARTAAFSASLGLGSAGVSLLNGMRMLSPDAADAFMGHHGASQATALMLQGANGMAAARGAALGGILNPQQLDTNMTFAASQGSLALRNNFTKAGAIDVSQTRGLSLDQAAAISSGLLSNRSNYTDWADKTMAKYSSLSEKDKPIKDLEVTRFRDGIGASDKAQKSFNEHIKKMSKEINGFVATVSKMTGSFEDAVEFMQKATGGKLYAAGEEADKLRQRAVKMAAGMRAIAADAGVDAKELFQMSTGFESAFNAGRGTYRSDATSTAIGANLAGALGKWKAQNPNASQEELAMVARGLQSRANGYATGDSQELNAIAGYLIDSGKLSMEEAQKAAGSNNADDMYRLLVSKLGRDGVANLRMSEGEIMALRREHQASVSALDDISSSKGYSDEQLRVGSQNAVAASRGRMESMLVNDLASSGMSRGDVKKSFRKDLSAAFSSQEALEAAGLSSEKAAEISEKAKKGNWSEKKIRDEVAKAGGDTDELTRVGQDKFLKNMADKYKDNGEALKTIAAARKDYENVYGGEITDRDMALAKKDVVLQENLKKRQDIKARAMLADTDKKREESQAEVKNLISDALRNENGSGVGGDAFLNNFIGEHISSDNKEEGKKLTTLAKDTYMKAIKSGASHEEAAMLTRDAIERSDDFKGKVKNLDTLGMTKEELTEYKNNPNSEKAKNAKDRMVKAREKAFDTSSQQAVIAGIMGEYLKGKDVSEDTRQAAVSRIESELREAKKQHPDWSDEALLGLAFEKAMPSLGEDKFKELEEGNGGRNDLESLIGTYKNRKVLSEKIHKYRTDYALSSISGDAVSAAEAAKGRKFDDKELKKKARLNKRRQRTDSIGLRYNQNSAATAELGADEMLVNGAVVQARDAMSDGTATSLIQAADHRDAKEANKTIGDFNASQLRYYNKKFKIDDNMSTTEDSVSRLMKAVNDGDAKEFFGKVADLHTKDGKVDETEAREVLKKFMDEHQGDKESDFKEALGKYTRSADIVNAFFDEGGDGKAKMAAFIKGAGKEGEDRKNAMREGYMMQSIANEGGVSKAPPEILEFLQNIQEVLGRIETKPA